MFCNKEYRLSCDSRGDFSIFRRISWWRLRHVWWWSL
jgi:hypothetical protein